MLLRAGMLASALVLSACTSLAPPEAPPAPVETREQPEAPDITRTPLPPAPVPAQPVEPEVEPEAPPERQPATPASTLLASVDAAIAAGELERAAALCERALRISPRDGNLWYRLATIRFQQRRYDDAAGFARRALSFSAANPRLTADSNRLLERAVAAQDDR